MRSPDPDLFTGDLFAREEDGLCGVQSLGDGAAILRGFVPDDAALLAAIMEVTQAAPLRHMNTPGGFRMSVAMTNCGRLGWISDASGYRYGSIDPQSRQPWPPMPDIFLALATAAAGQAGFDGFIPDACLINQYVPGARLTLHQDRNERDLGAPIVSVSLGIPAVFQFGGLERGGKLARVPLAHGDVVVWGGASRLRFHGVLPLKPAQHRLTGALRYNLTFRKAG
jgi:alkylated DNA repair protein (DNA oxidative demethylase)